MSDARAVGLNTGASMPRVGLGAFRATPRETFEAVLHALRCGFRHIDTAQVYANEAAFGEAVRASGVPRDEVFVTTKLWNEHQGEGRVEPAFEKSVRTLGLGAPDLFLLHWPVPHKRIASWRVLERLYREGRVRAIGVSNFMASHLQELLAHAEVTPAANQIEVSPFPQQREVRSLCARHGIVVQAYSPLTKGQRLQHPVVSEIGRRHGKTSAQILLRWGLQSEVVVLPKSVTPERVAGNLDVFDFELEPADMAQLDALEENLVTGWNPQRV